MLLNEGIVLEDTVQDDLVLFLTEEKVRRPSHAEFYDRSGSMPVTIAWEAASDKPFRASLLASLSPSTNKASDGLTVKPSW